MGFVKCVNFNVILILIFIIILIRYMQRQVTKIKELIFAYVKHYGTIAMFISLFLEYIGLPTPGESLMLMYGFLNSDKSLILSVLMATAGTLSGSIGAYAIGYRYGENIVLKIGRPFHLTKVKLDKADLLLKKHQAFYIIAARFIPGVRHIVPYLCGISRISFIKNVVYNLLSSAIWCTVFIYLGRFAGNNWAMWGKNIGIFTLVAFALIIFVLIVLKFFGKYKYKIFAFSSFLISFVYLSYSLIHRFFIDS